MPICKPTMAESIYGVTQHMHVLGSLTNGLQTLNTEQNK